MLRWLMVGGAGLALAQEGEKKPDPVYASIVTALRLEPMRGSMRAAGNRLKCGDSGSTWITVGKSGLSISGGVTQVANYGDP